MFVCVCVREAIVHGYDAMTDTPFGSVKHGITQLHKLVDHCICQFASETTRLTMRLQYSYSSCM